MLYTVAGHTFRGDALAAFQNCIADAMNLLPPEKGEEQCPRCGKSGPEARQVHTCMKARP